MRIAVAPDRANPHDPSNRPRAVVRIQSLLPTEFGAHHLLIDDTLNYDLKVARTGGLSPGRHVVAAGKHPGQVIATAMNVVCAWRRSPGTNQREWPHR